MHVCFTGLLSPFETGYLCVAKDKKDNGRSGEQGQDEIERKMTALLRDYLLGKL